MLGFANAVPPFLGLPDIDDVPELDTADQECLQEIRKTLVKHGKAGRFGVTLLHSHFEVSADEVLIEECDKEKRSLLIRPVPKNSVQATRIVETQWRLDSDSTLQGCSQYCTGEGSSHTTHHAGSPD